jgi:hypothetical protein
VLWARNNCTIQKNKRVLIHNCINCIIVSKNKLSKNKPIYRIVTGVFFLLLYSFVALPVQLWHHHSDGNYQSFKEGKEVSSKKIIADNDNSKADCKICSHQYPVYTVNILNVSAGLGLVYPVRVSPPACFYLTVLIKDQSNKSPPCLV